ncbi:MAG: hypothetical protein U0640_10465 [Phycisphaerales bacterium]
MKTLHSTRRFGRLMSARSLAALAGSVVAGNCLAIDVNWINPAGGNTSTLANWSPQHLPAGNDFAHFNTAGAYSVLWDAATPSSLNRISVEGGSDLTLTVANPLRAILDLSVNNATGSTTFSLTGGTITAGAFSVAPTSHPTFTGTMSITGPTARVVMDDDLDGCSIGSGGAGFLNINNGGSLHCEGQVIIGGSPSNGTVVIAGVASPSLARSTLSTGGGIGLMNLKIGIASGSSSLSIANGALVSIADTVYVSTNASTPATVSVIGSSLGFDATLSTAFDLYIGNDGSPNPAGKGTVTLNAGGAINVARDTLVGGLVASRGTLTINGGTFTTRNLEVKPGLAGTFNHAAGTVIVDGGTYKANTNGAPLPVGGNSSGGNFTLQNNAQWTCPASGNTASPISIAASGAGATLSVLSGSDIVQAGAINVGSTAGLRGTLNMSGGSTILATGALNENGSGSAISLSSGSTMSVASVSIASADADSTTFSMTGAGTTVSTPGMVRVGRDAGGTLGGAGALSITSGAVFNSTFVNATGPSIQFAGVHGAGGSLSMNNGTISTVDDIEYSNSATPLTMTNSTINATRLTINSGSMTASGTINAEFNCPNGNSVVNVGGPLTMGKASSATGMNHLGTLNVGPHTVTILDADSALIGATINIADGTLNVPNGFTHFATRTLTGSGTINSNIFNLGSISPTGAGLTLLKNLSDDGAGISGTRLTFASGSSYTGNGNLGCEVVTLAGSTITPSGQLLMGNSLSPNGVVIGGTLNVGPHNVELRDFNGAQVSGTVHIAGGTMFNPSLVRFEGGVQPRLAGFGSVVGDCTMNGSLEPGSEFGDAVGHIHFDTLSFNSSGVYVVDIEGTLPNTFDTITTQDDLDLGDASLVVRLMDDFYPPRGTVYRIATGGSLFGSRFGSVSAPGFHVVYGNATVDLVFDGLCDSIDFNNDDSLFDPQDIDAFLSVFSEGPCIPEQNTCNDIDFNNDGSLFDPIDIDAFLSMFGEGPCI